MLLKGVHQVPLGAGHIHQVEEAAVCALGDDCCCWVFSFPDHMQVQGSIHFHIWLVYFSWLRQSFPWSLPPFSAFFWGWGRTGLHIEHSHSLLQLFCVLGDHWGHRMVLVAVLVAVLGKPQVVHHSCHLPGAEGESSCYHVVADVAGEPVDEMGLEEQPVGLPRGQQGQHGLQQLGASPVAQLWTEDDLLALIQWLGGEELHQAGLVGWVGVRDVIIGVQYPADLLNHLFWESREQQIEVQPGVGYVNVVEGGLRQREPEATILGPEGWELHLGQRCLLLIGRQSSH